MSLLLIVAIVMFNGCASLSNLNLINTQHSSWAMNPADCAVLGAIVAPLLGLVPIASEASIFGTIVGKSVCQAESSLVAGQPAQITVTSSTIQGTTKTP
jgi:hypothetical protein